MEIVVRYEIAAAKPYGRVAQKIINQAAKIVRCPRSAVISVSFIGDKKMREFNRRYRSKDKIANVLAFPVDTPSLPPPSKGRNFKRFSLPRWEELGKGDIGDIFISLAEARREAKKYGWTMKYAVARLALHGFLHLLGYDHVKENEARKMERVEEKILKSTNVEHE